jgi:hypothetical protein
MRRESSNQGNQLPGSVLRHAHSGGRAKHTGCGNDDILDHCLGSGPHVRGFQVVDLLLAKE